MWVVRWMNNVDRTIQDEKNRLELFLRNENIEVNHNYLRMEKGPKPLFYRMLTLSYLLRFKFLEFCFLIFTEDCLFLLSQNEDYEFSSDNIVKIKFSEIHNFSFQRKYSDYCIFFEYGEKDHYYYLTDRIGSRALDKIFNLKAKNYSYENLAYLRKTNFKGLLQKNI